MKTNKQQFGQFFTKNTDYILSGMGDFVYGRDVCDPFAGGGDLLDWAIRNGAESVSGFDIDTALLTDRIKYNDSLKNPKRYRFVLTNPPYLYQNKMADNSVLRDSLHTDLYQLALEKIMNSTEGIVIVPINFLSAENSKYIRELFLDKFNIIRINYFTQQVFSDTTYNVIAFYYKLKAKPSNKMKLNFMIFPEKKRKQITVYKQYNWQIGGDFLAEIKKYGNKLKITRLEEEDIQIGDKSVRVAYNHLNDMRQITVSNDTLRKIKNNIVILKAIDTGTDNGRICLDDIRKYGYDALISIKTSRNQINLVFPSFVSISDQEQLIRLFNAELNKKRNEYDSLFMTNYRDKNRKRISFNFAYDFINYLYYDVLLSGDATQPILKLGVL